MRKIKIIQVLPTIVYGDAVSNDTLNIDRILKKNGFETEIYAENIGEKIKNVNKRGNTFSKYHFLLLAC